MNKKKDKVYKYVLTIAYKDGEDQCEFIQEQIIDEHTNDSSWIIGDMDLEDYFEDIDMAGLTCCIVGKA